MVRDTSEGAGRSTASIVIPTCDRPEYLELSLVALAAQTASTADFEVIVVNDGDSSIEASIATARSFNPSLDIRLISRPEKRHRAAARNLGLRAASGALCVFLDDDMIVSPKFVEGYIETPQDELAVVQGDYMRFIYTFRYLFSLHTRAAMFDSTKPALASLARSSTEWERLVTPQQVFNDDPKLGELTEEPRTSILLQLALLKGLETPWQLSATGNVAYVRTFITSLGGFDERFRGYGLEDLECGYRAYEAGARFAFNAKSWSRQQSHPRTAEASLREGFVNWQLFRSKHDRPSVWLWYAWRVLGWIDAGEYNAIVRGCRLDETGALAKFGQLRERLAALTAQDVMAETLPSLTFR